MEIGSGLPIFTVMWFWSKITFQIDEFALVFQDFGEANREESFNIHALLSSRE